MITGVADITGIYIARGFAKSGFYLSVLAKDYKIIIKDLNSTKKLDIGISNVSY